VRSAEGEGSDGLSERALGESASKGSEVDMIEAVEAVEDDESVRLGGEAREYGDPALCANVSRGALRAERANGSGR